MSTENINNSNDNENPIPSDTVISIDEAKNQVTRVRVKQKGNIFNSEIIILGLKLMAITLLMSFILSFVNQITYKKIDIQTQNKKNEAMQKIFTNAQFVEINNISNYKLDSSVSDVFTVKSSEKNIGYCVNVATTGFGGAIELIVGVDEFGKVAGIRVISGSETPNIGTKALTDNFLKMFNGLPYPIEYATITNQGVSAISGATITSNAVKNGINIALEAANTLKGGKE